MCQGAHNSKNLIGNTAGLFYNYDFIIFKNSTECQVFQMQFLKNLSIYQMLMMYLYHISHGKKKKKSPNIFLDEEMSKLSAIHPYLLTVPNPQSSEGWLSVEWRLAEETKILIWYVLSANISHRAPIQHHSPKYILFFNERKIWDKPLTFYTR